jgi:two-component system nitrate/nitrite response regulator NarL
MRKRASAKLHVKWADSRQVVNCLNRHVDAGLFFISVKLSELSVSPTAVVHKSTALRESVLASILVVDDHPLFRDGFAHMVRVLRPQWTLHFSESTAQALVILSKIGLDLIIIDVSLPGEDGFALLKAMVDISSAMPRILISGRDDAAIRMRARASGAQGFIAKTAAPDAIVSMIDDVLKGETAFDQSVKGHMPVLTQRQIELLMLLAEGHGNKEIRHRLNIAERTVRAHLTELFQILGAHSRMQALLRARELGLID